MSPAAADDPRIPPWTAGGPPGSLAARINVTVPLAAIRGLSGTPGEVAAFGPVDADVTRDLIAAAGLHPATRWCVTVVGPDGQAIGHGCAHGRHPAPASSPDRGTDPPSTGGSPGGGSSPPGGGDGPPGRGGGPGGNGRPRGGGGPGGGGSRGGPEGGGPGNSGGPPGNGGGNGGGTRGPRDRPGDTAPGPVSPPPALGSQARTFIQRLGVTITPLAAGTCEHRNQEPGYTLSPRLRHLIAARTVYCCAPGCRRPAARCDFDHTIPYRPAAAAANATSGPCAAATTGANRRHDGHSSSRTPAP